MTKWTVTYNDHISGASTAVPAQTDVYAAYYALDGELVEFKDTRHQVVFSVRAGIVHTIRRDDMAKQNEATA